MGESYPHMFLILLLLHGANAASKPLAGPKWQTLSGIFVFFLLFTYQDSINQHLPQRFAEFSIAVSALPLIKFQVFCLYN